MAIGFNVTQIGQDWYNKSLKWMTFVCSLLFPIAELLIFPFSSEVPIKSVDYYIITQIVKNVTNE